MLGQDTKCEWQTLFAELVIVRKSLSIPMAADLNFKPGQKYKDVP